MHFFPIQNTLYLNLRIKKVAKLLPNFYQNFTKLLPNFYQTFTKPKLHYIYMIKVADIYVTPRTMISKISPTNLFFSFKLFRNPKAMKKVANFCGTSRPWYQWYLHLVREPINYYLNLFRVTFFPPHFRSAFYTMRVKNLSREAGCLFIQKYKSTKVQKYLLVRIPV